MIDSLFERTWRHGSACRYYRLNGSVRPSDWPSCLDKDGPISGRLLPAVQIARYAPYQSIDISGVDCWRWYEISCSAVEHPLLTIAPDKDLSSLGGVQLPGSHGSKCRHSRTKNLLWDAKHSKSTFIHSPRQTLKLGKLTAQQAGSREPPLAFNVLLRASCAQ